MISGALWTSKGGCLITSEPWETGELVTDVKRDEEQLTDCEMTVA